MLMWSMRTPGIVNPNEELLEGVALKEEVYANGSPVLHYRYLSVDDLPIEAKLRFAHLFQVKNRYKLKELEPYCLDLIGGVGQPKSLAELALQHARLIDDYYFSK